MSEEDCNIKWTLSPADAAAADALLERARRIPKPINPTQPDASAWPLG